ncbi:MAG: hypothetical protein KAT05_01785, partial [Spirochaetes bacterium]|nr:hypothetical protein [Spirochaetota bacterium]
EVKSENQKIHINYSLNEDSLVTLEIIDPLTDNILKNLVDNSEKGKGIYEESWNGFDDNDTTDDLNDDTFFGFREYIVRLTAQDKDFIGTDHQKEILQKNVTLVDVDLSVDITISSDILSPDGDGINDSVKLIYNVNEPFETDIDIYKEDSLIKNIISNKKDYAGKHEASWDGRNNTGDIVANGIYTFNMTVTPLDGTLAKTFTREVEVKPGVTVDPLVINITYPEENDIISSTSGTVFSYTAVPKGLYYPPQTISYIINRNGYTKYIAYMKKRYKEKFRLSAWDWNDDYRPRYKVGSGWKYYDIRSFRYTKFSGYGTWFEHATLGSRGDNSVRPGVRLQHTRIIEQYGLKLNGYWDVTWYKGGEEDWTQFCKGLENDVSIKENVVVIDEKLLYPYPIKPDNLIDTDTIDYKESFWDDFCYITLYPGAGTGTAIATQVEWNKYQIVSTYNIPWDDNDKYSVSTSNIPMLYSAQPFAIDKDENIYSVDLYLQNENALTENGAKEENIELNNWDINLISPNDTAYIIDDPISNVMVPDANKKIIYNDGVRVDVGTQASISENGTFRVVLDKNKEKKFLKIKGNINTDINSYKVFTSPGTDIEDALWQEIYCKTGKPDQKDNEDYIFYNWDVTNLYGPYLILIRVEKDTGMVELVRKIKLGNKVTRGIPSVASSPYKKAILGFPSDAIPSDVEDADLSTPEIDVIVDILPIPGCDIDHAEFGMSIVGPIFDMKPRGLKFDKPVTLTYRYTDKELEDWASSNNVSIDQLESRLGSYHVYTDDGGNEKLEYMPGYIDKDNNVLTVMITGFSRYALVYDSNEVPKPTINQPGVYSKEGFIDINGKTEINFKVKFYLNGTEDEHFKGYAIVDDGSFSYKGLRLIEGLNTIYAVAINERDIASDASSVEITYDNICPEIEIIKVENPGFSPNNDGVSDEFRVSFKLNEDGRIQY